MMDPSKLFATSSAKTTQTLYDRFQATQTDSKDNSHAAGRELIFAWIAHDFVCG
jgi:hypothetical protein